MNQSFRSIGSFSGDLIPILSKTRFAAGDQCIKRLWLQAHAPNLAPPLSPYNQFLFNQGIQVGKEARNQFEGGVAVSEIDDQALIKTQELIKGGVRAIFEGAFEFNGVRIRVDILDKAKEGVWNLIEVKSSTEVKPDHLLDVGIQFWVLVNLGINIEHCFIMHIDPRYLHGLPMQKFYIRKDVTKQAKSLLKVCSEEVSKFHKILAETQEPKIEMGPFCKKPFDCEFNDYCKSLRCQNHITELPRLVDDKYQAFLNKGILRIQDIPSDFNLSPVQARVRECVGNNKEYLGIALYSALKNLEFPIYFLDFETVSTAFPLFPGTYARFPRKEPGNFQRWEPGDFLEGSHPER